MNKTNTSVLTLEMRALENEAVRLFEHPTVKTARNELVELFSTDRNSMVDRQRNLIKQAADEHAFMAVLAAVGETPGRPVFYWSLTHAHPSGSIQVPGSRMGIDNPDNVYRLASIDERCRYRITGARVGIPPIDGGITVMAAQPGENILANSVAYLGFDVLQTEPDGYFEITLDSTPANGRTNHLCITGGKVIMARDTLGDWLSETPHTLSIECVSPEPAKLRSDEEIAARAANYGKTMASFMLDKLEHGFFERRSPNDIIPPTPSGQNGGLVTQTAAQGWYQLAEDEALIVDVDLMGARYFGFQIADLWMLSYDYTEHLSSLNHREVAVDDDARVRFVISGTDPGVYNWLDGSGHRAGTTTLRWQNLPPGKQPDEMTVLSRVAKLNDLKSVLPKGTRMADASARAAQRARRTAGWRKRLGA